MDIESAKIAADIIRIIFKLEMISYKDLDVAVNKLQIFVFQQDTEAP